MAGRKGLIERGAWAAGVLLWTLSPAAAQVRWRVETDSTLRWFRGSTRVREKASVPALLHLGRHLGWRTGWGGRLRVCGEGDRFLVAFEGETFSVRGRGSFPSDFDYDEGHFRGRVGFRSSGTFYFLRALGALKLWRRRGLWLGPVGGLEAPQFAVGLSQPGVDASTESYHQFLPYPVVGFGGSWAQGPARLELRLMGTYVPHSPTLAREGGRLYMAVRKVGFEALLNLRLAEAVRVRVGLAHDFWDGELRSREDDNRLSLRAYGLLAGLEVRF